VRLTAHLAIECIMAITVREGALELKGSHSMGDGWIFLKTCCDVSFNKVLWNEPTFGPDPSRWTVPLILDFSDGNGHYI
jgi:hypothetical protein